MKEILLFLFLVDNLASEICYLMDSIARITYLCLGHLYSGSSPRSYVPGFALLASSNSRLGYCEGDMFDDDDESFVLPRIREYCI